MDNHLVAVCAFQARNAVNEAADEGREYTWIWVENGECAYINDITGEWTFIPLPTSH